MRYEDDINTEHSMKSIGRAADFITLSLQIFDFICYFRTV